MRNKEIECLRRNRMQHTKIKKIIEGCFLSDVWQNEPKIYLGPETIDNLLRLRDVYL
jgi:hypothetical protein